MGETRASIGLQPAQASTKNPWMHKISVDTLFRLFGESWIACFALSFLPYLPLSLKNREKREKGAASAKMPVVEADGKTVDEKRQSVEF